MALLEEVLNRSGNKCELCSNTGSIQVYTVAPKSGVHLEEVIGLCKACNEHLGNETEINPNHWRCLSESMWSDVPAIQVVTWRILNSLKHEGWPSDLLDMLFLDDGIKSWAESLQEDAAPTEKHLDSNGVELFSGDSVVLIKDLKVKGAGFTAKRGASVRNISLVHENNEHIEGKVNGQKIVILTQYVKK